MVTFRYCDLHERCLLTLYFYCPAARILHRNRVVRLLWSLFVTAICRSGVFGNFTSIAPPRCTGAVSFVLCARLLHQNRVVQPLCSLLFTAIYRSGVFGHFNIYALTAVYRRCFFALRIRETFTNRNLPVRCIFVSYC